MNPNQLSLIQTLAATTLFITSLFLLGFAILHLKMKVIPKWRMIKNAESEKSRRISEGDDILNEYEIGLEWGEND